jgi:hypothetical protein
MLFSGKSHCPKLIDDEAYTPHKTRCHKVNPSTYSDSDAG